MKKVSEQAQQLCLKYKITAMHSVCYVNYYNIDDCDICDRKNQCDEIKEKEDDL